MSLIEKAYFFNCCRSTLQRNNILNHLTRDIKKQLERSVADKRSFPLKINMDAGFLLFLTLTQLLLGQQIKKTDLSNVGQNQQITTQV